MAYKRLTSPLYEIHSGCSQIHLQPLSFGIVQSVDHTVQMTETIQMDPTHYGFAHSCLDELSISTILSFYLLNQMVVLLFGGKTITIFPKSSYYAWIFKLSFSVPYVLKDVIRQTSVCPITNMPPNKSCSEESSHI